MSVQDKKPCNMKVYVRQRPLSSNEISQKFKSIVHSVQPRELTLKTGNIEKKLTYDHVFGGDATQLDVYKIAVAPLIKNVIAGYNCTAFAYGQTGTGKTHTMFGEGFDADCNYKMDNPIGIIPRACHHLFSELSKLNLKTEYTVRVSFIEIYNEEVRDLLNENTQIRVYEDPLSKGSVCLKDLTKTTVCNIEDVLGCFNIGFNERQSATTNTNFQSSRSHTIFTILVNIREVTKKGEEIIKTGRLYLVDLAGSENTGRSGANDVRAREAGTINRSLITVSKVIKALAQRLPHVPYRDSKLTRILQDSFAGNTRTVMIATFSPNKLAWDDTYSILELAHIARTIQNYPQVNVSVKQANLLQELQEEITKMKEELSAARAGDGFYISAETFQRMTEDEKKSKEDIVEFIKKIKELEQHRSAQEGQYRQLKVSFTKTNEYLKEKQEMLEETRRAVAEKENELKSLSVKKEDLRESASILLNICEKSTQYEDIYHRKYSERCATNSTNAQMAKEMLSAASDCLSETERTPLEGAQFDEFKQLNISLMQDHVPDVCDQLNDARSHIESSVDSLLADDVQMPQILGDFKVENMRAIFSDIFNNNLAKLEHQKELQLTLTNLQQDVEIGITALKARFEEALAHVRQTVEARQAFFAKRKYMREELQNRRRTLIQQMKEHDINLAFARNGYSQAQQEEQLLLDELKKIKDMRTSLNLISQNLETGRMQESVTAYTNMVSVSMQPQQSVMADVLLRCNQQEAALQNQSAKDRDIIGQYVGGMTATIQEKLNDRQTRHIQMVDQSHASLRDARQNLQSGAMGCTSSMRNVLDRLRECHDRRCSDVKGHVQNSFSPLARLNERVSAVGHTGDTPAKISHTLPKKILDREIGGHSSKENV